METLAPLLKAAYGFANREAEVMSEGIRFLPPVGETRGACQLSASALTQPSLTVVIQSFRQTGLVDERILFFQKEREQRNQWNKLSCAHHGASIIANSWPVLFHLYSPMDCFNETLDTTSFHL